MEAASWFPDIPDMHLCGDHDLETPPMYEPGGNTSDSNSELGKYYIEDN